ncbi:MAG: type I restriction enzyme, S subunit [archaeon GW2011_AR13]|nr:MAG: type I restriction enzyme, S subunit [archaeon GW2011_AR13]HIG94297.1 restriction endonuclease subunit S [Nanoarchaeota archaeon]HIH63066.1 restriction endonuclease subunit S [Nanoarchaeota archaeon]HIJ09507.1 restriction endonuclease subunit S [Nanoarchaeota archaeon]
MKIQQTNKIEWRDINFLDCLEKEASSNNLKIQGKDFLKKGKYPIIDQGEEFIAGYTNDKSKVYDEKLPVIIFGDHTRILKFINFPFALGADGVKILVPKENISQKYFYYALKKLKISSAGYSRHYKFLKEKKILLPYLPPTLENPEGKPDLETQKQIVAILEKAEKQKEKSKKASELLDEYLKAIFNEMFLKKDFEKVKLGDICEINPKKSEIGKEDNNLEVSFVPMADISEHSIHFKPKEIRRIKEVYKGYTYFMEGDILLAKVTPCFENGKSGICKNLKNRIGFGSSEYHVLRPTKNILPELVYYVISSETFIKLGEKQLTGTGGLRRLPKYFVDNFKIPLPPLPLQQKFANIVEKVEKMKEKQKKTKQSSEELFDSLMQKAFRGEL